MHNIMRLRKARQDRIIHGGACRIRRLVREVADAQTHRATMVGAGRSESRYVSKHV